MSGRVLLIEDDAALRALLARTLPRRGYAVEACATAADGLAALDAFEPEVVLTDLHLAGGNGLEVCRDIQARRPGLPVVVMTAFGSLDAAVEAIRAGAYDFLLKPVDLGVLGVALDRALEHRRLREEVRLLRRRAARAEAFEDLVGESRPMQELFDLLERVAPAPSSVLVTGESGTGKELVAQAIHRRSPRRDGPFVAINCAAVPEALLESELFGHAKGAFTDARTARPGLFVEARGGTLLLDEVGDMPLGLQAKLLRALQERLVRPVGTDREVSIDVRVIAATHQHLERLVADGRFRGDLLYRLDVIRLEVPPLRARGNDVLLLAQRFVEQHAARMGRSVRGLTPEAARLLLAYEWPGNVRELQNCMERAVVLGRCEEVAPDDLPARLRHAPPRQDFVVSTEAPEALLPLSEVERRYVLRVLQAVGGSRGEAARVLGIDRKTLYRKLQAWGEDAG